MWPCWAAWWLPATAPSSSLPSPCCPTISRAKANESLAGALQAAGALQGPTATDVNRIAREAYVAGIHVAAIVAGSVVLIASAFVYRKLPAGNPHATAARH